MRLEKDEFWDLSLGPAFGAAGSITTLSVNPQCRYRVEMVFANDTGTPPGTATRIMQFVVGNRLQKPASGGSTLVVFFGPQALLSGGGGHGRGINVIGGGSHIRWDTCEKGLTISVQVSFVQAATFDISLFGRAVT